MWNATPKPDTKKTASALKQLLIPLIIILALVFSLVHRSNYLTCQVIYRDDKNITADHTVIKAEVANTNQSKELGLGARDCIGQNEGMLFTFNQPDYYPFWMKNMKFPIDIIWLSTSKRIVYIQPNVSPATYPESFVNTIPAQYVLELGAGQAKALNLQDGSHLYF